jgi:hypothetical protein
MFRGRSEDSTARLRQLISSGSTLLQGGGAPDLCMASRPRAHSPVSKYTLSLRPERARWRGCLGTLTGSELRDRAGRWSSLPANSSLGTHP